MSSGTATLSPTGAPARPTALIRASRGLFQIDFQALWQFRELLYFFVWRDLKVRYKQTALGAGLWLTALNVRYRDVGYTIPFLVQAWMFASPVVYSLNLVPAEWRLLYSLNPMVGVIEGFRWALLGTASQAMGPIFMSLAAVLSLVFGGILFFNRMERSF